ncbi:hypothetical protein CVT26_014099 [Gymnopilus dilepis]|uniref:Mid2 domain-containing protein n=1 Tax=Gymnopilus dilepis TaxID=231916 RepID=A0A409Y8N3_9AGAR|nr:hypothetical protein CVT26_014099 [Gymnopilus dilepis]
MPKAQRHSIIPIPSVLNWLFVTSLLVFLSLVHPCSSQELLNVTIPVTSSQITYTPFVCNATAVATNPESCAGAWQLSDPTDQGLQSISTFGPSPASANIIPQMFFTFRAFQLSLATLPSSNATMNVTVSANGTVVWAIFNSSLESIRAVNLPENEATFLSITFLSSSTPTRFDLASLTIMVPANASITSFLPPETLPPSISLPTFTLSTRTSTPTSASSTAAVQHTSRRKMIAEAVGLTLGLGLGLTVIAVLSFMYWKRRRHREVNVPMEDTQSGWKWETPRFS